MAIIETLIIQGAFWGLPTKSNLCLLQKSKKDDMVLVYFLIDRQLNASLQFLPFQPSWNCAIIT